MFGRKSSRVQAGMSRAEAEVRYVNQTGDKMTGELDMDGNKITNILAGNEDTDVVNKQYVDAMVENAKRVSLSRTGANSLLGALNMNGHAVTGLPIPTGAGDAANKGYVDQSLATYLTADASKITMLKPFDMGNQKISNLAVPVGGNDATNKAYVDSAINGVVSKRGNIVYTFNINEPSISSKSIILRVTLTLPVSQREVNNAVIILPHPFVFDIRRISTRSDANRTTLVLSISLQTTIDQNIHIFRATGLIIVSSLNREVFCDVRRDTGVLPDGTDAVRPREDPIEVEDISEADRVAAEAASDDQADPEADPEADSPTEVLPQRERTHILTPEARRELTWF